MNATTLSIIKVDIGSIGGHVAPSKQLMDTVNRHIANAQGELFNEFFIGATGDDIAILMVHNKGVGDEEIHRLAWDAFEHPFRDTVRARGAEKAMEIRRQGFSGPQCCPTTSSNMAAS